MDANHDTREAIADLTLGGLFDAAEGAGYGFRFYAPEAVEISMPADPGQYAAVLAIEAAINRRRDAFFGFVCLKLWARGLS